jgi:hypothetical protein
VTRLATDKLADDGDLDGLLRRVDELCDREAWDELVHLRDRARAAVERGHQLWPAASYAEYRLALQAPGRWAGAVLVEGAGRFALGPLPEVAASTHGWAELAPHAPVGAPAALAAHERVVRGEDLTGALDGLPEVLDLPAARQPWEPAYALATYEPDKADFPRPPAPEPLPVLLRTPAPAVDDPRVTTALGDLVRHWASESNGRVEVVAVRGDALGAVAALGVRSGRAVEVTAGEALAHLAWAGASGGAHGRRPGAAAGRSGAWWALTCLAGLDDPEPDDLGRAAAELGWWWWDAAEPDTGWSLRLAVEDPDDGLAWAINAVDATT